MLISFSSYFLQHNRKNKWQLGVIAEFSLYAPRRRLFWQNEKGESVRNLSHPY